MHAVGILLEHTAFCCVGVTHIRGQCNLIATSGWSLLAQYRFVTTSRDSGNICQISVCNVSANALEFFDQGSYGGLNTTAELYRVGASSHNFHALSNNCSTQNGGCGGAVSSCVIGLAGSLQSRSAKPVRNMLFCLEVNSLIGTCQGDKRPILAGALTARHTHRKCKVSFV